MKRDLNINTIKNVQNIIDWNFINTGALNQKQRRFLFRGVTNEDFKLIPKISRAENNKVASLENCKLKSSYAFPGSKWIWFLLKLENT